MTTNGEDYAPVKMHLVSVENTVLDAIRSSPKSTPPAKKKYECVFTTNSVGLEASLGVVQIAAHQPNRKRLTIVVNGLSGANVFIGTNQGEVENALNTFASGGQVVGSVIYMTFNNKQPFAIPDLGGTTELWAAATGTGGAQLVLGMIKEIERC